MARSEAWVDGANRAYIVQCKSEPCSPRPSSDVIDVLERIDRLIATAEARRNAVLREMERRRASLAAASRDALHQFESAETQIHSLPCRRGAERVKIDELNQASG
jgi:hypothetical protein